MRLLLILFVLAVISIVGLTIATQPDAITAIKDYTTNNNTLNQLIAKLSHSREFITPPPLRGSLTNFGGVLTPEGVLQETNRHRAEQELPPLIKNELLNQAATKKLNDMFEKQYFDHVAPDGTHPADVVESVGYKYLSAGENLALGNFASNTELVQAWMDSPGHRANILSPGFTQLGIAVEKGTFEGAETWLAVQTFALPESACPPPNKAVQKQFQEKQEQVQQLDTKLTTEKDVLERKAEELKISAAEVDQLATDGNQKIEEGNQQIQQGNTIAQQTGSREQAQPYWDTGEQLQQEGQKLIEEAQTKNLTLKKEQELFQEKQENYNKLVETANATIGELKPLSEDLNEQIQTYNTCVEQYQ